MTEVLQAVSKQPGLAEALKMPDRAESRGAVSNPESLPKLSSEGRQRTRTGPGGRQGPSGSSGGGESPRLARSHSAQSPDWSKNMVKNNGQTMVKVRPGLTVPIRPAGQTIWSNNMGVWPGLTCAWASTDWLTGDSAFPIHIPRSNRPEARQQWRRRHCRMIMMVRI